MSRVLVSALCVLSGMAMAVSGRDVLRALNKVKFKGSALLASVPNYRKLSRYRHVEPAPLLLAGVPLHRGRDRLSAGHEHGEFASEGLYGLHQLLVGRKGDRIVLVVVDGLWGDSYLGGFAAERVTTELRDALARQSLRDALIGLPEQLEIAVDRQVRGYKESKHVGDYSAALPVAEDAGTFVTAAELRAGKLQIEHIGNARLLIIRDGEVFWHTAEHNRGYRLSSNPEVAINPRDEGNGNVFRAIELPDNMGAPLSELLSSDSVELQHGDRIILASDSVWSACTNTDLRNWTRGRDNAEAQQYAREKIAQRLAHLHEHSGEPYDTQFALIIYDYAAQ